MLLAVGGCQSLENPVPSLDAMAGPQLSGPSADWSKNFRLPEAGSEKSGFSNRARQIEGNLGLR
jgi:hypothetical protein